MKNIEMYLDSAGHSPFEIKIDYGPGLRVYFGEDRKTIILLLIGGDKRTQKSDVNKSKEYWRNYEQNKKI